MMPSRDKEEKNNDLLKENMSKILDLQLAFETYIDNTGAKIDLSEQTYNDIKELRKNIDNFTKNENIIKSNKILTNFEKLLELVGHDKFIFYEDGKIEYKWDMLVMK